MQIQFGAELKGWRRKRGFSQLRLGLEADVSARHIAFLETGRSQPTRTMVIRLSEALEVPRRDRNRLLEAAGFAAAYGCRDMATAEMSSIRAAIDWTLERHEPYPGFALDRSWMIFAMNRPARHLLSGIGLTVGSNLAEAFLANATLRSAVENWAEVAQHLTVRMRTESRHLGGDPALDAAASRLADEAGEIEHSRSLLPAVIPTRLRTPTGLLSFFSTIAQFGSAEDIALADLKIELLFPTDQITRSAMAALADAS